MKYYIDVIKNYANFTGRARRSEYWFFALFNLIFTFVAVVIDNMAGTTFQITGIDGEQIPIFYGYIYLIYTLFVAIPSLAVLARRLHDTGKSGWFILIIFIPLIGAIWLLVLTVTDSVYGVNKYGLNPKGIGNVDEIDQIGNHINS